MSDNTMNQNMATRQNFWSLVSEEKFNIRIPRIQRDYAQGRDGSEAKQIRQALLKDIFTSLENNEPIDFNFIYGNINTDKKGNKYFIPIDGQQRLTTLFLLQWYFASWSDKLHGNTLEELGRFRYDTRFVAGSFCDKLVNDVRIDLRGLADSKKSLTDAITDYYWFFSSYKRDATIQGMLVMLQSIHEKVCDLPDKAIVDGFYDKLTSKDCPITFLFLDINDLGLTDEIYIKMNARGKALTRFENFKAQLSGYISQTDDTFAREFLSNINGEWASFFWHEEYRPEINDNGKIQKSKVFDDQILNLFRFFMFNEYATRVDMTSNSSEFKYLARNVLGTLSKESDYEFISRLFSDEYRTVAGHTTEKANVDVDTFRLLNALLNVLSKRKKDTGTISFLDDTVYAKKYIDEDNCFRRLIRSIDEKNLNYEEQLLLYAEFMFLISYVKPDYSFDKTVELTNWMRFVYNITHNMNYNTVDDYMRTLVRIRKMVEDGSAIDILTYSARILRKEYAANSGFGIAEIAMKEECIKAHLLLKSNAWKQSIIDAENSFMDTQLSALLAFSDIWQMYELQMSLYEKNHEPSERLDSIDCVMDEAIRDTRFIQRFNTYLHKINMIFDHDDLKPEMEKDSILRRALLTFGEGDSYMLPAGKPVKCFLDGTDRDNSFKRLFRDENKKDKNDSIGVRVYFKQLLDALDENCDFVPQLERIISRMKYSKESRWKKYFIEMPEILESLYRKGGNVSDSEAVFKNPKRFISLRSADQILLLEKTKTSSLNREYYSYVLYLRAAKDGVNINYNKNVSEDSAKFAYYTDKHGVTVKVSYAFDQTTSCYRFVAASNDGILYETASMNDMLCYIKGLPPTNDTDDISKLPDVSDKDDNISENPAEESHEDEPISLVDQPVEDEPEITEMVTYRDIPISKAFSENLFNRFRKYCDSNSLQTVGDLDEFDFAKLSDVFGIGKNKIDSIIERYYGVTHGLIQLAESEECKQSIVTFCEAIHPDIFNQNMDILAGFGIRQKSLKKLYAAGYTTVGSLAGISTEILKKHMSSGDYFLLQDVQEMLDNSIEEILAKLLWDKKKDDDFKMVLAKEEGHTLQEIGTWHNVTRENIRQKIKRFHEDIAPLMEVMMKKIMGTRFYFSSEDYASIFESAESLKIVSNWFKSNEKLEYLDFADTFVFIGDNAKHYREDILSLITEFIGDDIDLTDHLDEYDALMEENEYPFMDKASLLNLAQQTGYYIYRDLIHKGKAPYGLLCSKIVEKYFPDGIKIYEESEDLPKIKEYVYREFGDVDIADGDRAFSARLSDFLVLSGKGRLTAEANIHIEMWLLEKIKEYIDLTPTKEIYYTQLYSTFERELTAYSNVDNYNFLHGVLKLYFSEEYDFKDKDFLTKTGKNLASGRLSGRLLNFIMTLRRPVTKNEIRSQFPGIADSVIVSAVSSDENLMQWEYNRYFAMNCLLLSEADKKYLHDTLADIMATNNGYCSDNLIYDRVLQERSSLVEANTIHDPNNLFYICMKLFQDEFDFRRPHITRKDLIGSLSVKDVALHMLNYPDVLHFTDYQALAERLHWSGSTISAVFSTIEQDYVRISDDIYVSIREVKFETSDINRIETVLREQMVYGYVSLYKFHYFAKLPELQYPWNEFLLRSIIDKYLPTFKVIETRTSDRRYEKGIVVDAGSPFFKYGDIVYHLLKELGEDRIEESRLLNVLIHYNLAFKMIPKELYTDEKIEYKDGVFLIL